MAQAIPFPAPTSPNAIPLTHTFTAFFFAVVTGASRFAHADWLRGDRAWHAVLGIRRFPGEDTVRIFSGVLLNGISRRFGVRCGGCFRFWWAQRRGFFLDLDSTVFCREGQQEGSRKGYNPRRKGRRSHRPLLAVLAEAPFVLHGWLRSGNCSSARGVVEFLKEALALPSAALKIRCVRADNGFFEDGLLSFLEQKALGYIVVARMTSSLKRSYAGLQNWTILDENYSVSEIWIQLHGWAKPRRFVVVRERVREGKAAVGPVLLDVPGHTHRVFVTNRTQSSEIVWRDYNGRACVEQRIEELKNDLSAGGFACRSFSAPKRRF